MKVPRDISGQELVSSLKKNGFFVSRQTGSHIRLSSHSTPQYHITIPNHDPIKIGTMNNILTELSIYFKISKKDVAKKLFS
jgi:predicted RNA binding protein YcfA (HicA-like mRNA interferase family)